jgi:hypothetical protein
VKNQVNKVPNGANLLTDLFDRLTGKGAEISYNFERLEIDIPRAAGPQGQELCRAKWVVNGRLTITARTQTSILADLQ